MKTHEQIGNMLWADFAEKMLEQIEIQQAKNTYYAASSSVRRLTPFTSNKTVGEVLNNISVNRLIEVAKDDDRKDGSFTEGKTRALLSKGSYYWQVKMDNAAFKLIKRGRTKKSKPVYYATPYERPILDTPDECPIVDTPALPSKQTTSANIQDISAAVSLLLEQLHSSGQNTRISIEILVS